MKKISILFFTLITIFCFQLASFADVKTTIQTQQINGETYISLADAQKVLNFTYQSEKNNSITVTPTENNWIKNVVQDVNPSVVAIIGEDKQINTTAISDYYYSKMPAGLIQGSGVIVSQDGRIITNNHVVENMKEIYVVMSNKSAYKATLLYRNKDIDLALIKISAANLKPIAFESMENVTVGDEVIAIGTPLYFGWSNSVTKGIISGLNRPVEEAYTFLQTDASINPGNSGGPLINKEGKLVGINTLGITSYSGINFSIPVNNVQYFLNQYNKYGKIKRPYTGIEFEESWLALLGIPSTQGLKVITLKEDCILTKDQIREGDELVSIDGETITSIASYNEILKEKLPGDTVKLIFTRSGKQFTISAKLGEYPDTN